MHKYWQVAKITIQEFAAYPNKFYTFTLLNASTVFIFLLVWQAIFADKEEILGYTLPSIITYYTMTYLFKPWTVSGQVATIISSGIQSGKLSFFLIKPISFNAFAFYQSLADKLLKTFTPVTLIGLLSYFLGNIFLPPKPLNLLLFILSLLLASIISFLIFSLVGTMAFWTVRIGGIKSILGRMIDILNGSLFPLDFLPATISKITFFCRSAQCTTYLWHCM